EQPGAPAIGRDPGSLGGDDVRRLVRQIAHGLPADRGIGVEQPIDDCHIPTSRTPAFSAMRSCANWTRFAFWLGELKAEAGMDPAMSRFMRKRTVRVFERTAVTDDHGTYVEATSFENWNPSALTVTSVSFPTRLRLVRAMNMRCKGRR